MSYLRYLCFFEYSSVQQILRSVVFLCLNLVYPMFTVSLLKTQNMHVFVIHITEVFAKKLHRNNLAKNAYITSTKQENVKI